MSGSTAKRVGKVPQGKNSNEVISKLRKAVQKFLDDLDSIDITGTSDEGLADPPSCETCTTSEEFLPTENLSKPGNPDSVNDAVLGPEIEERTGGSNEDTTPQPVSTREGRKRKPWYRISPDALERFKKRLDEHKSECKAMCEELKHLETHYGLVGGEQNIIDTSESLREALTDFVSSTRKVLKSKIDKRYNAMRHTCDTFEKFSDALELFHHSLYLQKHAFYFRSVRRWKDCLENGCPKIVYSNWVNDLESCLEYMHGKLFHELEDAMKAVQQELKTFGEKSLPTFVADEKERATTRYVNITTIATFFSSVTATTLQFSLPQSHTTLGSVVNFFWFLSLVFSVSSGVSSLLGMTWRKSSIYDTHTPPLLIKIWLDKGPMVFLIIAAFAFIIGLNLFAYLSTQIRYVSLTTNVFTGLHSLCLLMVTAWFIYHLKHESMWAQWIRTVIKWISWPCEKYKENLHLQRNIYWSFRFDKRVGDLNDKLWKDYYPAPYTLAKIIRFAVYAIKKAALGTMRVGKSALRRVTGYCSCRSTDDTARDDTEKAMGSRQDASNPAENNPPSESPEDAAKIRFRGSLERTFGSSIVIDVVMRWFTQWTKGLISDEDLKGALRGLLWGYPKIVAEFENDILPVLDRMRNLEDSDEGADPSEDSVNDTEVSTGSELHSVNSSSASLHNDSNPDGPPGTHAYGLDSHDGHHNIELHTAEDSTSRALSIHSGSEGEQCPREANTVGPDRPEARLASPVSMHPH